MKRKVLRLSESFNEIKEVNLMLTESTSKELFEDPLKSMEQSKRWKIKSAYGDVGLKYRDNETIAYVASRMPAVYSACYRVLTEVLKIQLCGKFYIFFWQILVIICINEFFGIIILFFCSYGSHE